MKGCNLDSTGYTHYDDTEGEYICIQLTVWGYQDHDGTWFLWRGTFYDWDYEF